ncbi:MAG: tetratricopeptide repeat protein [Candidatus Kuenenia sp.]|nr:tetratricopeptide repeat protein [Candidatus Kuenenia hertensis]
MSIRPHSKSTPISPILTALIPVFSFLLYINATHGKFVYDDFKVIVDNGFIKEWKYFPALFSADYFTISGEMSYRPFVTFSYFVDYSIWHIHPFGFHLTNILLHAVNTVLFYLFLLPLLKNKKMLWLSTLFFITHPILTETVNSIGYREDLLSATFVLLSLIYFRKSDNLLTGNVGGKRRFVIYYSVSLIAYFFALFSKEMAITLPVILFLFVIFTDQRILPGILRRCKGIYIGYFAVSLFYLVIRFVILRNPAVQAEYKPGGFLVNIFTMLKVLASYIKISFFPFNLNADYVVPFVKFPLEISSILSVLFLCSVFVILAKLCKMRHFFACWMAWFFIMLLPVMNIIPIGNIMAERYLYLPVMGFCVAKGILIYRITDRTLSPRAIPLRKVVQLGIVIFMVGSNSFAIIRKNGDWRDEFSLWTKTLERSPQSHRAHCNLGNVYLENGNIPRAQKEYQTALLCNAEDASIHSNLGIVYTKQGLEEKAEAEYNEAIRLDRYYAQPHNNLGNIYYNRGQLDKAKEEYLEALRIKPDYAHAHNGLGSVYNSMEKLDEALDEFQKSLFYDSKYLLAINNVGVNYAKRGKLREAIAYFEKALALDRNQPQSYYNLGFAYENLKEEEKAIQAYRMAAQLAPNDFNILLALGNLYYRMGRVDDAINIFRHITKRFPWDAIAYKRLVFLYLVNKRDVEKSKIYLNELLKRDPGQADQEDIKQVVEYFKVSGK